MKKEQFHFIKVSQENIDNGIPGSDKRCPIALAMRRVFGRPVEIDDSIWRINKENKWRPLPPIAKKFILRFDNDLEVKPIIFSVYY